VKAGVINQVNAGVINQVRKGMSEEKKGKNDPPEIDLSAPYWGVPMYEWIIIVVMVIGVIIAIYAATRRR